MMQCECGYSSVFRLSDPEETHLMLKLYNVDETPLAPLLDKLGYKDMERCMFLGFTDGEKGFSKNVAKNIHRIARRFGAMPMTGYVTKSWEKGRFNDPYLRDTLMDFSVITDTLECSVNWSNMAQGMSRMRNFQRQLVADGLRLKAYPFSKILDVDHAGDIVKAEAFLNGQD